MGKERGRYIRCTGGRISLLIFFFISQDCQAALEGRAIVNLQMSNTFAAFVDMNDCLKVLYEMKYTLYVLL